MLESTRGDERMAIEKALEMLREAVIELDAARNRLSVAKG